MFTSYREDLMFTFYCEDLMFTPYCEDLMFTSYREDLMFTSCRKGLMFTSYCEDFMFTSYREGLMITFVFPNILSSKQNDANIQHTKLLYSLRHLLHWSTVSTHSHLVSPKMCFKGKLLSLNGERCEITDDALILN